MKINLEFNTENLLDVCLAQQIVEAVNKVYEKKDKEEPNIEISVEEVLDPRPWKTKHKNFKDALLNYLINQDVGLNIGEIICQFNVSEDYARATVHKLSVEEKLEKSNTRPVVYYAKEKRQILGDLR